MLSTVAERIYWVARYLERIESTARLISIYDKLLFDLPRSEKLSWYSLITINSLDDAFSRNYSVRDERNIVKFMLGDRSNPSSVVSSLEAIRENVRTTRDVIPGETWELINELSLYVQENLSQGIGRRRRHEFLDTIVQSCQQILGFWSGTMPRDEVWAIVTLGLNLERADMTSRNLDAGSTMLIEVADDEQAVNSAQIVLGTILRSVHAHQSYLRSMRTSVKTREVAGYLLDDRSFPRSVGFCLDRIEGCCGYLPNSDDLQQQVAQLRDKAVTEMGDEFSLQQFRDYLNRMQIRLGALHQTIANSWFPANP